MKLVKPFLLVMGIVLSNLSLLSAENVFTEANRDLETHYMQKLADVQEKEGKPVAFTTDGCSGGMSDSWTLVAEHFPAVKERYGEKPFWEECCVEHDRAYWQGESENGYEHRLSADQKLKQCVVEYAVNNRTVLAKRLEASEREIVKTFSLAADLMYHAVRAGGKPCSYLPWRWGYGWGHCHILF